MQPKKSRNTKVSVKIVPSSLSLPGMCALVSLVVVIVIVVVVVFRSIALQRAFFLPLSFFLSLSLSLRGNALLLSRNPLSCALIIPPSSHIPQLFTPSPLTPASQPAVYPSVESNDLDNLDDCPTNFYHANRSQQSAVLGIPLSFSLFLSLSIGTTNKKKKKKPTQRTESQHAAY